METSWAPPAALVALGWGLAVIFGFFAVVSPDAVGRLLLGIATVAVAFLALHGSIARPRLRADATGVEVRGLTGVRRWAWAEVNVKLSHTRRFGREVYLVELDADPELVLLGKLDLGADPQDVAEALLILRT